MYLSLHHPPYALGQFPMATAKAESSLEAGAGKSWDSRADLSRNHFSFNNLKSVYAGGSPTHGGWSHVFAFSFSTSR